MHDALALNRHHTSVDRAGWAIVVGGGLCALMAVVLLAVGGQTDPAALAIAALIAWLLSAMAITAVAAPIWMIMHATGRRGPGHAMLVGAVTGFVLFAAGQTHGFGLVDAPPTDMATALIRWLSAIATSLILALASGLVGLAMWRVAYRRLR